MGVDRREKDTRCFFLEPRPREEIRLHAEGSEIPGMVRKVRLARADGAVVVAPRGERFRAMQQRGCVAHLDRLLERLGRFAEEPGGDLRLSETDPGGGRIESNC